ncbi:hypothetical protein [Moorena sp. SIO4G3]|uniref:hypothetical protein n=1 Tax=Moorena sp. SIO4G3 TaxID=2607821 RepID=UPI00142C24F6|nr:hypothetical protein [Moorena sp. SIO4G3]NEO78599.1 hypothetical protein [Moorena sp. SIO4G3]
MSKQKKKKKPMLTKKVKTVHQLEKEKRKKQQKINDAFTRVIDQGSYSEGEQFPILLEDAYLTLGYKSEIKAFNHLVKLGYQLGEDFITKTVRRRQHKKKKLVRLSVDCYTSWASDIRKDHLCLMFESEDDLNDYSGYNNAT